jgi:hypothetical protein
VLLPLDALKIKRQVNPEAFRGRGVIRIFMEEGTTLYRGWGWTMARNAPGSFAVRDFSRNLAKQKKKVIYLYDSFSVLQPLQRNTSSMSRIIPKQHGHKTLLPPSLVP